MRLSGRVCCIATSGLLAILPAVAEAGRADNPWTIRQYAGFSTAEASNAFYRKALAACTESLAINPRSWRTYNNRAIAHIGLGNLAAARRDLEAGRALNPDAGKLREVEALLRARETELRRA